MTTAIFLLLPASALSYASLAFEEFEQPKVFALIAFACFAAFWVNWRQIISDRIAFWISMFTLSAAISTVLSIDWHMSLYGNVKCRAGLLVVASMLVLYLAMSQNLMSLEKVTQAIDLILAAAFVVSVYAIAQVLGFDFKQWVGTLKEIQYTRPMSFLGHPNFMANYLAMVLPFAIWRFENTKTLAQKILCGAVSALALAAIFFSLSRGMIIACVIGLAIYFVLMKQVKGLIKFSSVIAAVSLTALIALPNFRATAFLRLQAIAAPGPARLEYPKAAIRIWKRAPFFGIGTDAFEIGFQNQRTPFYWEIEKYGSPHRAHNDLLNILATQGLLGVFAALMFTFSVTVAAFISRSPFRAPAIASIAVFYVAGLTSFYVVATGVLFLLSIALLRVEQ